jgi:hypothetical protein
VRSSSAQELDDIGAPEMRIAHRRLTVSLAIIVTALAAATASTGSATKCKEGTATSGGKLWIQYCGPATAITKQAGKAPVKFTSGHCIKRKGVMILYLGRRPFSGTDSKTKYWEFVGTLRGDGVYRKGVFVEWWLGKKHYMLGNITMTFKNNQRQATYTGKLLLGGKGTASGSFRCLAPSA